MVRVDGVSSTRLSCQRTRTREGPRLGRKGSNLLRRHQKPLSLHGQRPIVTIREPHHRESNPTRRRLRVSRSTTELWARNFIRRSPRRL